MGNRAAESQSGVYGRCVGKRLAWIRSWWFVVLVILLIAIGLAVALINSGSDTGY
jgi:hypothetical protein